jgi:hypothetical protein
MVNLMFNLMESTVVKFFQKVVFEVTNGSSFFLRESALHSTTLPPLALATLGPRWVAQVPVGGNQPISHPYFLYGHPFLPRLMVLR